MSESTSHVTRSHLYNGSYMNCCPFRTMTYDTYTYSTRGIHVPSRRQTPLPKCTMLTVAPLCCDTNIEFHNTSEERKNVLLHIHGTPYLPSLAAASELQRSVLRVDAELGPLNVPLLRVASAPAMDCCAKSRDV